MADDGSDALSDVLRLVRLRACVYFVKNMRPGWGISVPAVPNGPLHLVLDGTCVLRHGDRDIELRAGDAVLFPHGARHEMLSDKHARAEFGPSAIERLMAEPGEGPDHGATRMLCGHFEWDGTLDHPMFNELPEMVLVRGIFDREGAVLFRTLLDLITGEMTGDAPGASAVADRMGEVLFVSLLRSWMEDHEPEHGVLATLRDARLSRALTHMHERHGESLDLDTLARAAGMSRTTFATQFAAVMGTPPATYLTEWRMLQARRMLVQSETSVSRITEAVGYASDAAFVRAFKRVCDLLCMINPVHASTLKEHDDNDDFQGTAGRAAERS